MNTVQEAYHQVIAPLRLFKNFMQLKMLSEAMFRRVTPLGVLLLLSLCTEILSVEHFPHRLV